VVDPVRVVAAFAEYMERGGHRVTREQFEQNLAAKLDDSVFTADIGPSLVPGCRWDRRGAAQKVSARFIALLPA
jgi:hypothetical protein